MEDTWINEATALRDKYLEEKEIPAACHYKAIAEYAGYVDAPYYFADQYWKLTFDKQPVLWPILH